MKEEPILHFLLSRMNIEIELTEFQNQHIHQTSHMRSTNQAVTQNAFKEFLSSKTKNYC